MNDEISSDIKAAMGLEEQNAEAEIITESIPNSPDVNRLWNEENPEVTGHIGEFAVSDDLRLKLDNLAKEKERLMDEKQKLSEALAQVKLEEELALMKKEVDALAEENMNILMEIQRRKQTPGTV